MNLHEDKNKHSCCINKDADSTSIKDPVCGMGVDEKNTSLRYEYKGSKYSFCSQHCLQAFTKNPDEYLAGPDTKPTTTGTGAGRNRAPIIGALGGLSLLIIFFSIVTLANGSFGSAFNEFQRIWYWLLLLASGFGFQLGLFVHLKQSVKEKMASATAEVAASGTISTGSMIACCSHALVNVLPILGISAAAAFLAQYQLPFILIGVFSNLIGITIMLGILQKHGLLPQS
jgi:YHS domain-containing protein